MQGDGVKGGGVWVVRVKKIIILLKHQLMDLEDDMIPGQSQSDKDR